MADVTNLFNYYRRYRWRDVDFAELQSSLVQASRGPDEGLLDAAVLKGFDPTLNGDMTVDISAGLAVSATGYLNVVNEVTNISFEAPTGAGLSRGLVVVRPLLDDNTDITNPTNPFATVPLKTQQGAEIAVLAGAASGTPAYPALSDNEVVLFGVRLYQGQTVLAVQDLDFEVRDIPGKNSNFHQNNEGGKGDDRLRPFLSDYKTLGIKPSQLLYPFARAFSYVNRTGPSIFPKTAGGLYNHADTLIDMETGAITGGDEVSADLTPTIPASGNSVVACVAVRFDDTIVAAYGTEGTREQCYNGILNQAASGAGSVSIPASSKPVSFAIVSSLDGATVSDVDLVDIRGALFVSGGGGGGGGGLRWNPTPGFKPLEEIENGEKVFLFSSEEDQSLTTFLKVPASYQAGSPIKMLLSLYSPSTSGNVLLRTTATLIRKDTDAVSSTTNQRTSINTELTNSVANQAREIECDLTDDGGAINSVEVSAGDLIKIVLSRVASSESSSDSAETRFIPSATEVSFS